MTVRFIEAVQDNKSVITTHALFALLNEWDLDALKNLTEYELIIDETIVLVNKEVIRSVDIELARDAGLIEVQGHPTIEGLEFYSMLPAGGNHKERGGILTKIINAVSGKHIYVVDERNIVFVVPPEKFESFRNVTLLTYLFDGSETNAWLDVFRLPYEHKELYKIDETKTGKKPHDCSYSGKQFEHLLTVYDDKINDIGEKHRKYLGLPLGQTWFVKKGPKHPDVLKLYNNIRTFFRHMSCKREDFLWTCFKPHIEWLRHNEFALKSIDPEETPETWLAANTRATNAYSGRHALAFLINVNQFPELIRFFNEQGVNFNNDNFALSRVLQWTWRSAIRKGEPVTLYLPSERMRTLVKLWFMDPLLRLL